MKILHCPSSVGGNPQGLARAERAIGLDSHSVILRSSPFGYAADESLHEPGMSPVRFEVRRWRLLWQALRHYDVIHFNFGRSILPSLESEAAVSALSSSRVVRSAYSLYAGVLEFRDLPWLKRAGKAIAVTFQGDDARQGDRWAADGAKTHIPPGYYSPEKDRRRRDVIRRFDRYADLIFALNPDLLRVLPERAQFMPYAHVDPNEWKPVSPHNDRLVIAHAPTHEGIKGTTFVRQAVEQLRRDGLEFEFRLLQGLSHSEVRTELESCDLLVDQLLLGWYGGISVEAMALGLPVVCYVRDEDLGAIPAEMKRSLPLIRATPETIASVLRETVALGRDGLRPHRKASRAFVERWHDPTSIARHLRSCYESVVNP